ncbi:MAG TPA: DEAD/DEAH box helicase, partial [Chloroflexota bacterium]|nr:DEAD/DEAH box helicase [Chloroflexota bacterium]
MNPRQIVDWLQSSEFGPQITAVHRLPERPARYGEWPASLDGRIVGALAKRGIARPYTHQAEAIARVLDGDNVVVVTPTASGKTMCYNVPVLHAILAEPEARALYVFPTKALAQDQLAELRDLTTLMGVDLATHTFDGDTPANARRAVRQAGQVVITNPDMLHSGILPHHTQWHRLFANLKYVVIDEMHVYRGVFGSNVGNVIRRLKRICAHYGASPRFILSSASIANPVALAENLIEEPVSPVTDNGAPAGEKYLVLYNPPVVNRALGIRTGSVTAARRLAGQIIGNRIHTIVFARSRLIVEILLRYLRTDAERARLAIETIQGYRGGYLPNERRAIERGLRDGTILAVVATNALELGIDIGSLEACVMVGYPGTVASTWQQLGRAGRRESTSVGIMVASSSPLDQYVVGHPDYLLGAPIESGLINPDNLFILANHVKCAAFELPFADGDVFGRRSPDDLLRHFGDERILFRSGDRWFWSAESFPAHEISLRTASAENVVIVDQTNVESVNVIGEMDRPSAATMLHDEAIYIHGGRQFEVIRLDWEEKKAFVRAVEVDYYTDANLAVRLAVLDQFAGEDRRAWGEVSITYLATIFKKIKLETHENVGWGKIRLPEDTFHTTSFWLTLPPHHWTTSEVERGLNGVSHVLGNVAPLFLMCDPRDLGVYSETRGPFTQLPTVFVYDSVPGGVGFAERLYGSYEQLIRAAADLVDQCSCDSGCPSCVGAPIGDDDGIKSVALGLLK